jgi:hypothetical protein
MSRRAKYLYLIAVLPMVLWLFYSRTAYWHFHISPSGIVIEHSHPYKNNPAQGTPFQKHNHTDFEYSVLAQLGNISSIIVFLLVLAFVLQNLIFLRAIYHSRLNISAHPDALRLRGPPAL